MAHVDRLITDNWVGAKANNREVACRSLDDALIAIGKLNGTNHTQVVLKGEGSTLVVGGGNQGRYSVELCVGEDEEFHTLIDPAVAADGELEIVTGGQAGLFPKNQAVTLAAALEAARYFYTSGKPSPAVTWRRQ